MIDRRDSGGVGGGAVSQYYRVGDDVLWNPSNGVSALFLRTAEALAPETGLPTGLGPIR
ncbi:DUF6086 family protein [Nonomuraea sp. N2-4H]|uniref:DUF6086 family protein n=1 Tax=Nonomuraea sp. N2-4H TaxID=3128898 RepID=UPI00324583B8